MELRCLTADEILTIHEALVADFSLSNDPISPPGVRSADLLHSAVSRQFTGLGNVLKYPDAIPNAATLMYGLCNDHPFHNGNKRTALVAMLVHLDKNKIALFETTQEELYDLMLKVASHTLFGKPDKRAKRPKNLPPSDKEVEQIAKWLKERADGVRRGERVILYRDLERILTSFGYYLEKPHNNRIQVVRYAEEKKRWPSRGTKQVRTHVGTIPWPGEGRQMSVKDIKDVRRMCHLREEDGVDSVSFYDYAAIVDAYVNKYRALLRRLAKV